MIPPDDMPRTHEAMDAWGKQNNLTVTYADWHPVPSYGICATGSFGRRNTEYPSGLVLIDDKGNPHPWSAK